MAYGTMRMRPSARAAAKAGRKPRKAKAAGRAAAKAGRVKPGSQQPKMQRAAKLRGNQQSRKDVMSAAGSLAAAVSKKRKRKKKR